VILNSFKHCFGVKESKLTISFSVGVDSMTLESQNETEK
jgi:hypothetical protein